ncbi:MAG: hypothetical protein EAZ95_13970 [Bacteroidetes bacterium]|nr:MAG: hypothetical protein EAZ95_13970 [Bacteroidota bacterium]
MSIELLNYFLPLPIHSFTPSLLPSMLRWLFLVFDAPITLREVGAFRGAVAKLVGWEHTLFHQHEVREHRYPLIQYKRRAGKAGILFLGDAVDEANRLFEDEPTIEITLHDAPLTLRIHRLDLKECHLRWGEAGKRYTYFLRDWLPFAQEENLEAYEALPNLREKLAFLERILAGHIISFAKGVDWQINEGRQERFSVQIQDFTALGKHVYKLMPFSAFDVQFSTELYLPPFIGLGKAVTHGFGVLHPPKKKREKSE